MPKKLKGKTIVLFSQNQPVPSARGISLALNPEGAEVISVTGLGAFEIIDEPVHLIICGPKDQGILREEGYDPVVVTRVVQLGMSDGPRLIQGVASKTGDEIVEAILVALDE